MLLRICTFLLLLAAAVGLAGWFLAWAHPVAYLKLSARGGFELVPTGWVVELAKEQLVKNPSGFCRDPFLLSWHGSFDGGPVGLEVSALPASDEYDELVMGRTDYITARTEKKLDAMAGFNRTLMGLCFRS